MGLKYLLKLYKLKKAWRKQNSHNFTVIKNVFNLDLVQVGRATYGPLFVLSNYDESKLIIGNYCSIANDVHFILNSDHHLNHISTYPFKFWVMGEAQEATSKGNIIIDDDVWIGARATILSGIHIGQGAVVAAGAVVTKNVPPYAIVGGVPAKIVKYRFEDEIVKKLLSIDYNKLTPEIIKGHIGSLYEEVNDMTDIDWLPKK